MSNLDLDDRQVMLHNYRQIAEILSLFRKELRAAGLPRWIVGVLVLRQFEVLTREYRGASIHIVAPDFGEEEQ